MMAAVLAFALTACASGTDEGSVVVGSPLTTTTTGVTEPSTAPSTAPPSPPVSAPPATTPTRPEGSGGFSTTPVSVPATGEAALLGAVRAAGQQGFDRVVFEFTAELPGYKVGYVERPVLEDGSGKEVSVTGAAVLEVRMAPASGAEVSASGVRPTYTGPARIRPSGTVVVAEVVRVGDFEGQLTWVVGTSGRAPFKVSTFSAPPRLVIDVGTG
jgi:hypothetical protein